MKPLVIVGAGGLGREVAWLVEDINRRKPEWNFLGFLDDGVQGKTVEGYQILGTLDHLFKIDTDFWVVVAIANLQTRQRIVLEIEKNNIPLATLVHPSTIMSDYVKIESGSIICAASILTTNIHLGKSCIINPGCFIGHDTFFDDFVSLMPGCNVAGEVRIGTGCFLGLNSSVINRKSVGEWSVIGAGATVISDIPAYSMAVGVPAQVIKSLKNDSKSEGK